MPPFLEFPRSARRLFSSFRLPASDFPATLAVCAEAFDPGGLNKIHLVGWCGLRFLQMAA